MHSARKKSETFQLLKQTQAASRLPIANGRDSENTEFSSEEDDTCSDLNTSSDRSIHPTRTLKLPTVGGTHNVMENSMPLTRDPSATGRRSATSWPTKKGGKGKSKKTWRLDHSLAAVHSTNATPKQK